LIVVKATLIKINTQSIFNIINYSISRAQINNLNLSEKDRKIISFSPQITQKELSDIKYRTKINLTNNKTEEKKIDPNRSSRENYKSMTKSNSVNITEKNITNIKYDKFTKKTNINIQNNSMNGPNQSNHTNSSNNTPRKQNFSVRINRSNNNSVNNDFLKNNKRPSYESDAFERQNTNFRDLKKKMLINLTKNKDNIKFKKAEKDDKTINILTNKKINEEYKSNSKYSINLYLIAI